MVDRNQDGRTGLPKDGPPVSDGGNVAAAAQAATQPPAPPAGNSAPAPGGGSDFLNFSNPTEWVDLPSKGKYYPQGHPWHNKEQVEIKYMTAKEEDILASRSLLKKGVAIDRMIKSVCVDHVNVESLLTGDKNALMVAARVTGYGTDYPVQVGCPVCGARNEVNWDLSNYGIQQPDDEWCKKHSVEWTDRGYKITLPKTGCVVNVRFLTGRDEEQLEKLSQNKKKANLGESRMTDQFRMMIVDVNGNSDRGLISKFSDQMPAGDSRVLRKSYIDLRPDIDTTIHFVCPDCASESEVDMPMTAQFFWPE